MPLKICIVGGNGFIGSKLASRLRASGIDVLAMSRNPISVSKDEIRVDFFDYEQVENEISRYKPEILISTAWITTKTTYRSDVLNEKYKNATLNLGSIALRHNMKRIIVLGTCAEYGGNNSECVAGNSKLKPNDLYARMKVETYKELTRIFDSQYNRLTWARVFQPYGRGQDPSRFIPYIVHELRENRVPSISNPWAVSDWITTRDISSAIEFSMDSDLPPEIDVGTGIATTNWDLAKLVSRFLGKESLLDFEPFSTNTHAQQGLVVGMNSPLHAKGWRPKDTFETGLEWALDL